MRTNVKAMLNKEDRCKKYAFYVILLMWSIKLEKTNLCPELDKPQVGVGIVSVKECAEVSMLLRIWWCLVWLVVTQFCSVYRNSLRCTVFSCALYLNKFFFNDRRSTDQEAKDQFSSKFCPSRVVSSCSINLTFLGFVLFICKIGK